VHVRRRLATLRRAGVGQVFLARLWLALDGDERMRRRAQVSPGELVVDVGAYRGDFTEYARRAWAARVIAVEPVPEFADVLKERFEGDSRVTILRVAVGARPGTARIALSDNASSQWSHGEHFIDVPMADIAGIVRQQPISLMKFNAEGAEFDALERLLETGQIEQVRTLQIQFHRFVPAAATRRRRLRSALSVTHECSWSVPWVWEQWSRR
jgi:FkbM family methyltransferase